VAELNIQEVDPASIPTARTRTSSEFYKKLVEQAMASRRGGLSISTEGSDRTPKSIYWGLSLYIRKNNLKGKLKAILREKEKKVFIKKLE